MTNRVKAPNSAAPSASVTFREFRTADREWVAAANIRHYTELEGFDASFARAVDSALDMLVAGRNDEGSKFLIAERTDASTPAGCIFFSAETPETGRIRLFYLEEALRGRGVGKHMLDRIRDHACRHAFNSIRVSTFDRHEAACRLYRIAGFRGIERDSAVAFGQNMRQIDFELDLTGQGDA